MAQTTLPDVLTLEEASDYLRLPIEAVLRRALQGISQVATLRRIGGF